MGLFVDLDALIKQQQDSRLADAWKRYDASMSWGSDEHMIEASIAFEAGFRAALPGARDE
jgi:hypothetical protein